MCKPEEADRQIQALEEALKVERRGLRAIKELRHAGLLDGAVQGVEVVTAGSKTYMCLQHGQGVSSYIVRG